MQRPILNPNNVDFGVRDALARAPVMVGGFLPQEWQKREAVPAVGLTQAGLRGLVFGFPLLLLVVGRAALRSRELLLLVLPSALGVLMAAVVLVAADWDIFLPRYLYPTVPALALFAAAAWRRLLRAPRAPLAVAALASVGAAVLWFDGILAFYFTDLGGHLGFS